MARTNLLYCDGVSSHAVFTRLCFGLDDQGIFWIILDENLSLGYLMRDAHFFM